MIFLVRYLCAKYMTAHKISLNITKPKTLSSLIIQGVAECYKTISNDRNDVRDAEVAGSNPVISTIRKSACRAVLRFYMRILICASNHCFVRYLCAIAAKSPLTILNNTIHCRSGSGRLFCFQEMFFCFSTGFCSSIMSRAFAASTSASSRT